MIQNLPQYRSHKKVGALRILNFDVNKAEQKVELNCEGDRRIVVTYEMYARHKWLDGWYLVQYQDGFVSFSPGGVFEEGYTRIPEAEEVSR